MPGGLMGGGPGFGIPIDIAAAYENISETIGLENGVCARQFSHEGDDWKSAEANYTVAVGERKKISNHEGVSIACGVAACQSECQIVYVRDNFHQKLIAGDGQGAICVEEN